MFFLTLLSHTRATCISTLLLCQGSCLLGHVQGVRSLRCATTFPCIRALLRAALNCDYQAVKRKISRIKAKCFKLFLPLDFSLFERQPRHSQSTFRLRKSFISSRLRPPTPRDRLLEARFSLFLRESFKASRSPYPQKFTLSACAALRAEQLSRSRLRLAKV